MASAVATSSPAAMSYGWLGPRLSFGRDSASPAASSSASADHGLVSACKAEQAAAVSKEFIDFEFSFGGSGTMLPADELFADGKLLPLRPQPVAEAAAPDAEREPQTAPAAAEIPATPELVRTLRPTMPEAFDPYVFSPKAPTCSSRWRELLRLRKVQTPQKPPASPSTSPSPSQVPATPSRASNSSAARSLKLLLRQRSGGRASDLSAAPLLRDSSDSETSLSLASSRFSMSSSSSSSAHDHDDFPRHSVDSVDLALKPRIRLVRSQPQQRHCHPPASAPPRASHSSSAPPRATHSPARRRPAAPPPPSVASVDSPRMNSSGKIVFQGLERSSSSPAGSAHSLRSRSRVMDRSYSTPVVLNVPVCSRPSFGFFKDKKDVAAKDAAAARLRSSLGRKAAHPAGSSSVSCRDLVSSK
ncbi:serine/arginine repetitive matrix protein 1-like [Lolium rigidum]|uniref:serine/arginine repetitive matrix protein 1-like n=1 Tax=Lolium rigidum TaxID=89674 RepID=UPI001F5D3B4D|nr:serine/arginine repetitive matrix protein 1-like [Lolium rigidum]